MIKRFTALAISILVSTFARALTGVLPNWRGCLPETRQRVYFANHASHGDFVLIWTVLPGALRRMTRPVAAVDYWGKAGCWPYLAADSVQRFAGRPPPAPPAS